MNIIEATDFLSETAEADSNLEETAVRVAQAVHDAYEDIELADSSTQAIVTPLEVIDPVVDVGAQIPVPPCTDLKPVASVMGRVLKLMKQKILPALNAVKRAVGGMDTVTSVMAPLTSGPLAGASDVRQHAHDARSVTGKIVSKFPGKLPRDLQEEVDRITDAANRAEAVLKEPLQELDDILVGLHKLDPLINLTTEFRGLHDALEPVVQALDSASTTFGQLLSPFSKGLKKINDATIITRNRIEEQVEGAINKVLGKLGLKKNIFKAVKKEIAAVEDTVTNLLWTPVQRVSDEVRNNLAKQEHRIEAAVHSYVDLRGKIARTLEPLDDLLVAYIGRAARHGIHPD